MKIILMISLAVSLAWPAMSKDIKRQHLSPNLAEVLQPLVSTAHKAFSRLPNVVLTNDLSKTCKPDEQSNRFVLYCSDLNEIFVAVGHGQSADAMRYRVAHVFGHAVQVRHGIANRALRAIRTEPAREGELRGMVTRQVDCIAGVLIGRAYGGSGGLTSIFNAEPMTGSHWGATPMRRGPKVSIGLTARDAWFRKGRASKDFANCAVGEMGAELILRAER